MNWKECRGPTGRLQQYRDVKWDSTTGEEAEVPHMVTEESPVLGEEEAVTERARILCALPLP